WGPIEQSVQLRWVIPGLSGRDADDHWVRIPKELAPNPIVNVASLGEFHADDRRGGVEQHRLPAWMEVGHHGQRHRLADVP
ncbi:MAG TPA: hypothetical protein VMU75_01665, partial [Acidimicrobiales bacterium]|nr:hypothetical protein [Acidimicrobiales bacterium]